jgi:hypothetical protein
LTIGCSQLQKGEISTVGKGKLLPFLKRKYPSLMKYRVKVYKPDGSEYISPGGDLFVWEGCQACADTNGGRVDFSGMFPMPTHLCQLKHGLTTCGVGSGYKVEITDEQIVQPTGHPPPAPKGVDTWTGPGTPGGGQMAIAAYKAAQAGDVAQGNAKTVVPPAGLEPIAPNAKGGIVGG